MKHYWKYLKYVLRHKLYVFQEGRKLGVPLWNLILHDWDKFMPKMFRAYANYFYNFENLMPDARAFHLQMNILHIPVVAMTYTKEQCEKEFDETWNRHQKISKHHWQAHVRKDDDGSEVVMQMSEVDALEMLADWLGAGRAIPGADPFLVWYRKTEKNRQLHPATKAFVEYHADIPVTIEAV